MRSGRSGPVPAAAWVRNALTLPYQTNRMIYVSANLEPAGVDIARNESACHG